MRVFTKLSFLWLLLLFCGTVSAQNYNVTFKVDMSQYTGLGASDTVYVNGTWNSWCGKCNPLVKQGSTQVWEATISIPTGAHEFKYTINGWSSQESLTVGTPCTITTGAFTNRAINVTANTTLPVVCWQSCSACAGLQAINLPVNFDSSNVDYTMTDFGGNISAVVADPVVSTNKVAKVTKPNTAELWAGTTVGTGGGFATAIPVAPNATKMTMRVYSPDSGILVKLKIENASNGSQSVETDVRTTKSNSWETLEFNFANQSAGTGAINYTYTYKKASVFFNFGVTGATAGTKIYYFDDLKMVPPSAPVLQQVKLPINYDSSNVNYAMVDFGGNASSVVVDPTNANNKVGKAVKSNTAELWAGTTLSTTSGLAEVIPFSANSNKMSVRVYSPDSGISIKLKAEVVGDPTKSVETDTRTTVANAWQTLEFDFANQSSGTAAINYTYSYKMLSIFFNFGVTGATAGNKTYYFDDVRMTNALPPPPQQVKLPINFDATNVDYTMVDFGGNASSVVADPNNANNKVAKFIKGNTAELWAGTTLSTPAGLAIAIPFAAGSTKMKMKVFSPDSGIVVKMKAEVVGDGTKSVETDTRTTVANAWQVLEFDFANQSAGTAAINYTYSYKMLSVFFNFGTTGATAGTKTYYADDIEFAGSIAPPPPSKVDITFRVDMKNVPMAPGDTVTLNGTFNNWCGACIKLNNVPGTKVWYTTVPMDTSKEIEYKFTIGNWAQQETLKDGSSCTKTTGAFINRVYRTTKTNDTLPLVCWESCAACAAVAPPKTTLTFRVDMSKYTMNAGDTVTLNGTFNNWCGACNKMTRMGSSNVWQTTLLLDKDSSYDYKYVIGNWASQETLKDTMPCVTTKSGFTNRTSVVSKLNDTLATVCWESCGPCKLVGLNENKLNAMRMYPNPAGNDLHVDFGMSLNENVQVSICNLLGAEVLSSKVKGSSEMNMNIESITPGVYMVKVTVGDSMRTFKLIKE